MLFLDPMCKYVEKIAMCDAETEKSIKSEIETGLIKFSLVKGVEIRTYCEFLTWGGIFIDDQRAIIMHFVPSVKKTCFLWLRDGEISIFKSYRNKFEEIWEKSSPYR